MFCEKSSIGFPDSHTKKNSTNSPTVSAVTATIGTNPTCTNPTQNSAPNLNLMLRRMNTTTVGASVDISRDSFVDNTPLSTSVPMMNLHLQLINSLG